MKTDNSSSINKNHVINKTRKTYTLILDELGDTICMEFSSNSKRTGLYVQMMDEITKGFKLYTVWNNDTLVNVLNSTILFVDHKNKVISKNTFCQLVKRDIYNYGWIFRPISENLKKHYKLPYDAVISCRTGRDYSFLKSKKDKKTDDDVMHKFLKKNRKRIEILNEN